MKKNHTKRINKKNKAFTLVEMLLVIAIIGILSAVVFVMFVDSSDARRSAVMSTAKSSLSFIQVCKFKGWDLNDPSSYGDATGGAENDYICSSTGSENSLEEWPEISIQGCEYEGFSAGSWDYKIGCDGGANFTDPDHVKCSATNGVCEWVND